jgi:peptidoglycan hydrolase-like protein with peptidoglycan-binding domain
MTRKFALVAGLLLSSVSAGSLLAQTSATTKPSSGSSMQHTAPSATAKPMAQDSTSKRSAARDTTHQAWTKDQIKEAQQGLAKAGFFKGQATGVYGKETKKAIRAYQKANKLPVTGRLNNNLLTRLHSA